MITSLLFLLSKENGLFWDNVLFASKMGNYLFENSIFNWSIPDSFDPGHPPFLGFLLALVWKIFGQNLWSSHLLMFPFIFGVFVQLFKFISFYVKDEKKAWLAFAFIILDPTLSTQFIIVNPEVIIVFFFFLAFNGIIENNKKLHFIGLFFLSIISFRSMMLLAGLFIFDFLNRIIIKKEKIKSALNFNFLLFYLIASLPGIFYIVWRLFTKGWLQTHPNSPWSSLWQLATPKIFFKNSIVLIWRFLDFGRIFFICFIIISLLVIGKKIFEDNKNKQLILLAISPVFFIIIACLISTNSFGHRYFIVAFIALNLLSFRILINYYRRRKVLFCFLFFGLIFGNFWIYPKHISQGWDATLGHIPYHNLRKDAIYYLEKNKIPINDVATFFPNYHSINTIELNGDNRSFQKFNGKNEYVFYSNIYNLSKEDLINLDKNYKKIKEFNSYNINITIYILK